MKYEIDEILVWMPEDIPLKINGKSIEIVSFKVELKRIPEFVVKFPKLEQIADEEKTLPNILLCKTVFYVCLC